MSTPTNYAGIDIGSNAIRLLIAHVVETKNSIEIKKNTLIRIPIRLGEDVFTRKIIGNEKKITLMNALIGFKHIMAAYSVIDYKACATSAMREAENRGDIVRIVQEQAGMAIDVIDGQEEADIIFSGSEIAAITNDNDYMYVDVGGGSTEITVFCNNKKVAARSFPLGTVRILNQGFDSERIEELSCWLKETTALHRPSAIVGTGGNINKVQKLLNKKAKEALTYSEIKHLYRKISGLSVEERIQTLKMDEDRADVIVPAMHLFLTVMDESNIVRVFVPKTGLADGIVRQLYMKHSLTD